MFYNQDQFDTNNSFTPLSNDEMKISGYFHMKKENHPTTWIEIREDRTYWENEEKT